MKTKTFGCLENSGFDDRFWPHYAGLTAPQFDQKMDSAFNTHTVTVTLALQAPCYNGHPDNMDSS